jgi:hypothetical protein
VIVAQIINGFGNQLFQYATAKQVAKRLGSTLKLDLSAFQRLDFTWQYQLGYFKEFEIATEQELYSVADPYIYHTPGFGFTKKLSVPSFQSSTHFLERTTLYQPEIKLLTGDQYLEGYFQSDKYISEIRDELLAEFKVQPRGTIDLALLEKIKNSNSIAVHIRRGDYATNADISKTYGVCSSAYYQQAINHIKERVVDAQLFIFSNDIEWCRRELNFDIPVNYVSGLFEPPMDFYLMSACKHFVIANSTFSWWAAWLGESLDKIVAEPKSFFANFQHMFPDLPEPDLSVDDWVKF